MRLKNEPTLAEAPVVDLRTPRSTFDQFCRSVIRGDLLSLMITVHADLRFLLQRQRYQLGEFQFLQRLKDLITGGGDRLLLGAPDASAPGEIACPLHRNGLPVGSARFVFSEGNWLLYALR